MTNAAEIDSLIRRGLVLGCNVFWCVSERYFAKANCHSNGAPFLSFLDALTSGNWVYFTLKTYLFILEYTNSRKYNGQRLQSALSITCGQFRSVFISHKCGSYHFVDILDLFHDSQGANNRQVVRFVAEHYGIRTNDVDMDFLGEVLGLY